MVKFLLLWPLRKLALVPTVIIGAGAFGAIFGSFEGTVSLAHLFVSLPAPDKRRPGTSTVAVSSALGTGGLYLALRELAFKPKSPPAPALPGDEASIARRLTASVAFARHYLAHYPYAFRFKGFFGSGALGGLAFVAAEKWYNRGFLYLDGTRSTVERDGGEATAAAAAAVASATAEEAAEAGPFAVGEEPSSSSQEIK